MPLYVVGYEGGDEESEYPVLWGASAIRGPNGVFNAALSGPDDYCQPDEDWRKAIRRGNATATEVPIEIDESGPFFTVSMRLDLLDREPYKHPFINHEPKFRRGATGIVAVARGTTRGYYVFESHERLEFWLYHLHAGKFELVPVKP